MMRTPVSVPGRLGVYRPEAGRVFPTRSLSHQRIEQRIHIDGDALCVLRCLGHVGLSAVVEGTGVVVRHGGRIVPAGGIGIQPIPVYGDLLAIGNVSR